MSTKSGPEGSTTRIVRSVAALSVGTLAVQGGAMVSQLIFAIWLGPADFGYWASATSLMAVLSGLINLGEVSGYLANPTHGYIQARSATLKSNAVLALCGLLLALLAFRLSSPEVAWLVLMLSLLLPVTGLSALLVAVYMREKAPRRIVLAQGFATLFRIGIGMFAAWLLHSALALFLASVVYTVSLVGYLMLYRTRDGVAVSLDSLLISGRSRVRWAINSLAQSLPGQADYLVLTFTTTPVVLGTYYLAYQITVGVSALVASPLSKVTLARLAELDEAKQRKVLKSLAQITVGGTVVVSAISVALVLCVASLVPSPWQQVPSVAAILFASLPSRFLAPLTDARLMATNRWGMGTLVSSLDAIGTGVAALTIVFGSIEQLAVAMVAWKLLYGLTRFCIVTKSDASGVPSFVLILVGCTIAMALAEASSTLVQAILLIIAILGGILMIVRGRGSGNAIAGTGVRSYSRHWRTKSTPK